MWTRTLLCLMGTGCWEQKSPGGFAPWSFMLWGNKAKINVLSPRFKSWQRCIWLGPCNKQSWQWLQIGTLPVMSWSLYGCQRLIRTPVLKGWSNLHEATWNSRCEAPHCVSGNCWSMLSSENDKAWPGHRIQTWCEFVNELLFSFIPHAYVNSALCTTFGCLSSNYRWKLLAESKYISSAHALVLSLCYKISLTSLYLHALTPTSSVRIIHNAQLISTYLSTHIDSSKVSSGFPLRV